MQDLFFPSWLRAFVPSCLIGMTTFIFFVVFVGLMGAIIWNIITWLLALPTSSSHALVSGAAGAAIAKGGFGAIVIGKAWGLLLLFIVLSPMFGFLLGTTLM